MAAACALALVIGCSSETEPVAVERVTLNAATLTLSPGATGKLTATVLPENADDKTVTWSSSDTEVATVGEDGTLTAVSIGEATITARAGGKEATCAVTVCVHSYSGDRCTKCGFPKPVLEDGEIDDDGVLTKYSGNEATVVIPDGVTGIKWGAFEDCTALTDVTIPASVTSIGVDAFRNCGNLKTVAYGGTLAQWCALDAYYLMAYAGQVTMSDGTDLKHMPTLAIPDGARSIGDGAFKNCAALTSVTIPASVVIVGGRAFADCTGLTDVTIPEGVTDIGFSAFWGCTSLVSVEIPGSVTSIGNSAFRGCTSLAGVKIPEGVTKIGNSAFFMCTNLTSVTIPASVTEIGRQAFYGCTSLTTINYTGTEAQWNAITKGSDWDTCTGCYTITYNYTE